MITIEVSNVYHRRDSGWEGWGDLGFARSYSVYFVRLSPVKTRPCEVFQLSRTNLIITCSSFSMWTLDVVRRISTFHISLSRLIRCSMFGETRASAYHILHNRVLILSDNWILTLHHSVCMLFCGSRTQHLEPCEKASGITLLPHTLAGRTVLNFKDVNTHSRNSPKQTYRSYRGIRDDSLGSGGSRIVHLQKRQYPLAYKR